MHYINLGLIFVAGLDLGLAVLVYSLNPKNKINIYFALGVLFIAIWTLGMAMFREAKTETAAIAWTWVQNGFGSYIVIPFFFFSIYFPYQHYVLKKWQKLFIAASIVVISLVVVIPGAWTKTIRLAPSNDDYKLNFWGILYFNVYFYFYYILGFYNLFKKYFKSGGFAKIQLSYIIAGLAAVSLVSSIFAVFIPLLILHSVGPYWIGPYFSLPIIAIIIHFIYRGAR
jgi:hypothetical protein